MSVHIVETDSARFERDVLAASAKLPVLVDFWASWCGPCLALAPLLERLAEELAGQLVVAKVDCDREPQLAAQYGVRALPTLKLFRHAKVVEDLVGLQSPAALRAVVSRHLTKPADVAIERARKALASGQARTAVNLLQQAQSLDPDSAPLRIELARALFAAQDVAGADAIIRELPANVAEDDAVRELRARIEFARALKGAPSRESLEQRIAANADDLEARYLLGARSILDGDAEAALEEFIEIMSRDRSFREDLGRRSLLAAFEIVGESELTKRYRARMAGLLH
jgi:putative thioredoxin